MSTKTHERPTLDFNTRTAAILRNLIGNSKRTAREIGEAVGISNVTISRTLTGKTRLSRKNFERLRDELCTNKHEHRLLERAYDDPTFANFMLDEIPTKRGEQASYASAKILAALRADEASLRKSARSYLEKSGLNYESDYVIGDAWLDFVVTLHVEDYDSDVKLKIPIERQTGIILERGSERRDSSMLSFYLMLNTLVDEVVVLHPDEESGRMTEEHPKEKRIPISQLSAYLAKLKAISCPPPRDEDDLEFEKKVKASLSAAKIKVSSKKHTDCIVREDKSLIALQYQRELKQNMLQTADTARELKERLKCSNVWVIIPDEQGIRSVTMEDGIQVLSVSQLTRSSLDLS